MFKHFNFIFPVFLLVTSCTTTLASRAPTNLENQINKSKNSIVKDDCDDLFFSRKIEIINALDEKNINSFVTKKSYIENEFNIIPFGPITLREPTTPLLPYDNWQEYSTDWTNLYKFYQSIQSKEVNTEWVELSRIAHSLLMNDERRLTKFYNFNLDSNSYSMLIELQSALNKCIANVNCSTPDLTSDQINVLSKIPLYLYFYKKHSSNVTIEQKRYSTSKILQWVNFDIESRFAFSKNRKITTEGSTLILPLKAGAFESVKGELAKIIEDAWSSNKIHVKIIWVSDDNSNDQVYKLIADISTNGRSFTSARDFTITIANTAKKKSIIHEIGHVLGFKEYYYEIFDSNNCGYKTKMNSMNIMSDINQGIVTESMLSILEKEYFKN